MLSVWFKRALLSCGVVLAAALLAPAAQPKTGDAPPRPSLAGQLLIAAPGIGDPRFYHAVVLVVRNDKDGTLGILLNRPVEEQSMASLMEAIGEPDTGVAGKVEVFAGGPVQLSIGFIVHSAEYRRAGTVDIDGRVAMTTSPDILRDIGHGKGPKKFLVAFGYTGWGAGQLEDELAQHAWYTEPETPKLVFDEDRDKLWDEALARRTVPL